MKHLLEIYNTIQKEEQEKETQKYQIYCDMDGVLTDFDERFDFYAGIGPREYESKYGTEKFWNLIDKAGVGFWVGMKWMPDGKQLWNYIKPYSPIILSAPSKQSESRLGKRLWVRNNIPNTKLILSKASEKRNYSGKYHILIDDRPSNIQQWIQDGGIGIFHTSAQNTIEQLKKLGL